MTEDEFTHAFTRQAEASLKDVHFKIVQPLQINTSKIGGYGLTVFLNNAYAQYSSSPSQYQEIMRSQIDTIKAHYQTLSTTTESSILAVIKPADYLITVKKQLSLAGVSGKEIPLVYTKINDDLYVFFVFDTENGMRLITKKDLAEKKINETAIFSIATRNLSSYFQKKQTRINRLTQIETANIYTVSLDENYEASILLLNKFWNRETFDVKGSIVAFVPARNTVIVTGSNDQEGIRIAGYLAEKGFKELGYAISPKGYVFDAGTWMPLKP